MKEVTSIKSVNVDQQTIDTLKELLKEAESGNILSICFIDYYVDGTVSHGWSGRPNIKMMGQLENLKFDFFSQMYFPVAD